MFFISRFLVSLLLFVGSKIHNLLCWCDAPPKTRAADWYNSWHLKKKLMRITISFTYLCTRLTPTPVSLFEKSNFCQKNSILTRPQHFHEFFTQNFFGQFFSWNQSCQQLKSPKSQHFHEFFTPPKIDNFLGKSTLNFWTKN